MRKPVLVIGCGGHAASLIDIIESGNEWEIVGLVGLEQEVGSKVLDYPVLGAENDLPRLRESVVHFVLAVGQIGLSVRRKRLALLLEALQFEPAIVISPAAVVSRHARIGAGTTIGHGAIVNACVELGRYCIINSRALIEHHTVIGDYCHISTGALVNGNVKIGDGSFIGSGSVIREGLVLPDDTVISAGRRVMGWPLREKG